MRRLFRVHRRKARHSRHSRLQLARIRHRHVYLVASRPYEQMSKDSGVRFARCKHSRNACVPEQHHRHIIPGKYSSIESLPSLLKLSVWSTSPIDLCDGQVKSHIGALLSVRNPNTVSKCFSTLRRVYATLLYKDQVILEQVLLLEDYGLKPQEFRNITLELKAEARKPLFKEMGSLLDVEIRNAESVDFRIKFDVRYFRHDRLGKWKRIACIVTLKTPPVYSGGLLSRTYYWHRNCTILVLVISLFNKKVVPYECSVSLMLFLMIHKNCAYGSRTIYVSNGLRSHMDRSAGLR